MSIVSRTRKVVLKVRIKDNNQRNDFLRRLKLQEVSLKKEILNIWKEINKLESRESSSNPVDAKEIREKVSLIFEKESILNQVEVDIIVNSPDR